MAEVKTKQTILGSQKKEEYQQTPTLEDVRKALSGVKGSTFHIDGGLVYIYHTIIHDENHL